MKMARQVGDDVDVSGGQMQEVAGVASEALSGLLGRVWLKLAGQWCWQAMMLLMQCMLLMLAAMQCCCCWLAAGAPHGP